MTTLYDVARAARVSTATVSRVVHDQAGVNPATRQRVLEVIEQLGYVPDGAAQSMARRRKEVVGLVMIENRGPETDVEQEGLLFIDEILRGVEAALAPVGWSVLITVVRPGGPGARQQLRTVAAKVDGILISEGIVDSGEFALLSAHTPVVLVAGSPDESHADVVYVDNVSGTTALASHLIELHGRRRFCYVAGPPEAPDARERRRVFEQVVARHRDVTLMGCFPGRFATVDGQQAVREMLANARGGLPDAIVCANDQMAIGAMRELQASGIRVPADIAVVGFDDIHLGAMLTPSLTTVRQSMRQLGNRACTLLLERIADPSLPRRTEQLPVELIVRESCGCPPQPGVLGLPGDAVGVVRRRGRHRGHLAGGQVDHLKTVLLVLGGSLG